MIPAAADIVSESDILPTPSIGKYLHREKWVFCGAIVFRLETEDFLVIFPDPGNNPRIRPSPDPPIPGGGGAEAEASGLLSGESRNGILHVTRP